MKIGLIDLEILSLGIKSNGRFDEKDIQSSKLGKQSVGRILDTLAVLREKNLIELNPDNTFGLTKLGKNFLWDSQMPLWLRILRLLDIQSFSEIEMQSYLNVSYTKIKEELETMRKKNLIMMSTIRKDGNIEKTYELLPSGQENLEKFELGRLEGLEFSQATEDNEILNILKEIRGKLSDAVGDENSKKFLFQKIDELERKLGI